MSKVAQLNVYIDECRERAFQWGVFDCCQFVRRWDERVNLVDRGATFGEYFSELGAGRLLVEHGGMEALLREAFGEAKPVAFAMRGDVVLADFGRGPMPSICIGTHCVAPSENGGLAARRMLGDKNFPDALMAWSI